MNRTDVRILLVTGHFFKVWLVAIIRWLWAKITSIFLLLNPITKCNLIISSTAGTLDPKWWRLQRTEVDLALQSEAIRFLDKKPHCPSFFPHRFVAVISDDFQVCSCKWLDLIVLELSRLKSYIFHLTSFVIPTIQYRQCTAFMMPVCETWNKEEIKPMSTKQKVKGW